MPSWVGPWEIFSIMIVVAAAVIAVVLSTHSRRTGSQQSHPEPGPPAWSARTPGGQPRNRPSVDATQPLLCERCGSPPRDPLDSFCARCGSPLEAVAGDEVEDSDQDSATCSNCGNLFLEGDRFCRSCGAPRFE
jgi:hypothetical protein